jgi:PAS domain S-box-containing protein
MTGIEPEHAQQLFELSLDLLIVADAESRILNVNPSWERVLGYRPEELVGRWIVDLHHPDDVERTRERLRLVAAGQQLGRFENRYRHADGHWVWLRWTVAVDARTGFVYGAARDVTAERRAMEEAGAAVHRMEIAQQVAHVGSWEIDLRTGARTYSREMYAILGMDPERDQPWGLEELLARVAPEHHRRIREAIARTLAQPGTTELEYRLQVPADRRVRTIMEAVRDADGTPEIVRGTTQDVTELRQNERRLAEAERLAGIGSFEWRVSDSALRWSRGTYRLFGVDPSSPPVNDERFWGWMLPAEAEHAREVLGRAAQDLQPWELEYSIPDPAGGRRRRVLLSRGEAYDVDGEPYVRGTIEDVTQQRLITRQQQEIARLGQLALAGTDLRHLFDEVCRVAMDLLGTDLASILALQDDGSLAYAATRGYPEGTGGTAIAAESDSIVLHALTADGAQIVGDWLAETALPYPERLRAAGVRCSAVLPIRGREGPFGVLATHAVEPGVVSPEQDVAFLDALATFLATAIDRLRHEAEIAALATLRGRLVAENLEAEERVRQRISETLHDGALQDLLAARQDLVEAAAPAPAGGHDEMLSHARQGVERAVRLLREAVHALHPVVLQHGGLEAAMRAAADQAARQGNFRAEVAVDPAATGLRDELVLSLARELLTNCAKHAQAHTVRVTVGRENATVLLEVADDGRGIDADAVAAAPMSGHIGLASLAQRVEAVGGTLDLGNAPDGSGTTVLARLPIG